MKKPKAIAFDLVGVLVRENDFALSETEILLESSFGKFHNDEDYLEWANKETNIPQDKIVNITIDIMEKIYELRDPDIFSCLDDIKLAIASNHLSYIRNWLSGEGIDQYFDYILISAEIGIGKPSEEFFKELVLGLNEDAKDILFIDDNCEYVNRAKELGFMTMHYKSIDNLKDKVVDFMDYFN